MTSGNFASHPLADITKRPRQRSELKPEAITSLAESIRRLGLIHPLVIDRQGVLVAGETRLEACRSLGWTHVPIQFADEVDEVGMKKIELEENLKRTDLTWQDQVRALEELHLMMRQEDPEWSADDTAAKVGLSNKAVWKHLAVAREMKTNERIAKAPQFSVARGLAERAVERRRASEVAAITGPAPAVASESILNVDFAEWARTYSGPRFNFLHCDFPYGINLQRSGQLSSEARGVYDDSEDVYFKLLTTLAFNWDRLVEPSAHIIFWYSMKFHRQTMDFFANETQVTINPLPLIWMKSDGAGILPDPQRGPRQIYETALFGHCGDRKITSAVANGIFAPTNRNQKLHVSEKPQAMLQHFFKMVVDENTRLLDPTCGSGSALRAAEALGAKHVLGLERDKTYFEDASTALRKFRAMSKVSEQTT